MNINPAIIVNAWTLPSNVRHEVISRVLDALPPRQAVLLVNDHDPNPLFYQWDAEQPGQYLHQAVDAPTRDPFATLIARRALSNDISMA